MKVIPQATCDRLRVLCGVHSLTTAAEIVGLDRKIVAKVKSRGFREAARPLRPMPPDFRIQCDHMTVGEMMVHYAASGHTISRWSKDAGREFRRKPGGTPARSIPDDLPSVIARLGPYGAAEHYGVHYNTVKRWRKAVGLPISWSRRPKVARR